MTDLNTLIAGDSPLYLLTGLHSSGHGIMQKRVGFDLHITDIQANERKTMATTPHVIPHLSRVVIF
jgi:hypothetical protein